MRRRLIVLSLPLLSALMSPGLAQARDRFEVTITNITRGQQFTPFLVASHNSRVNLFSLGQAATTELATLAESGATAPLAALLTANKNVKAVNATSGLLNPGQSVTITVDAGVNFNQFSAAAMLIPTNDAFVALNNVNAPREFNVPVTFMAPVYDAGSEKNDELCASIPGPHFDECGGAGGGADVAGDEEGFVHVHAGIHGIGDLKPEYRDWRNPAAKITIRRIH
ncbi:spondin domain-containing protein [Methylocucumis oryzae]|uniref:Spondin domain-containing protein n=1 Tax=Methylocucumis oryzae TaxID=1632867 RepID=A0A0F3IL45_9GAMM|nr:spondin domain-containing protein [Methylocucumis oryzae]KJV07248.1 hypothetical protein VZ94_06015 [Methylocucumis oryzae]